MIPDHQKTDRLLSVVNAERKDVLPFLRQCEIGINDTVAVRGDKPFLFFGYPQLQNCVNGIPR